MWMRLMKKIENIQQTLDLFEKYSISRENTLEVGNSRVANYNYKSIKTKSCLRYKYL